MINSASEIGQFDFAVNIADQGIKVVKAPEDRAQLAMEKSLTLRKAALTINNFDDFKSYKDRFIYLCDATRTTLVDRRTTSCCCSMLGKKIRSLQSSSPANSASLSRGDAVPVKPEWLRRLSLEVEYTSLIESLIGFEEFHLGNNEAAIKSWGVAQKFDPSTREFIAKILEVQLLSKQDKLDNFETIISEALVSYPEARRIQMLRGLYYTREKKYQAAIDDYRSLLQSNPGKPNEVLVHQKIKSCYQLLGQPKAAAEEQKIIDAKSQRLPAASRIQALEKIEQMKSRQATTP